MTTDSAMIKNNAISLNGQSEDILSIVQRAFSILVSAQDLSPKNPVVCYILDDLYAQVVAWIRENDPADSEAILQCFPEAFLQQFRALLAKSEEEMEYYWSAKLYSTTHVSYETLKYFIYWDNYQVLTFKEYSLLKKHMSVNKKKTCFIGSGPLPLTMLIYNQMTKNACVGVDASLRATRNAQRLSCAIGSEKCEFVHEKGQAYDYSDCEVIFIASMIDDKDAVIKKIKQDRGDKATFILVRTVENLSRLYYEPYICDIEGFVYLGKTEYDVHTVNTALLYRLN